jgi:hypothetical protein
MLRGGSRRVCAVILATGLVLIGAGSSAAFIGGSYNGAGKGFTISFHVKKHHVDSLNVACGKGAITVEAIGVAPKVKKGSFAYSGPAQSSNRTKTLHMKVTGTFSDQGKKVKGKASTSGDCPTGKYTASK